jgi:transposase
VTDPDAVFQKTGGGYKVGYRMECAVDEQEGVIIASDVSNDKRDTKQLMGLLDQTEATLSEEIRQKEEAGQRIAVTADSGFSSLENLHALENRPLYDAHIPDQTYQTSKRKKEGKKEFHKDTFVYDEETDVYICPAGAILKRQAERIKDGQKATIYGADKGRCKACEYFGQCTKNAAGRTLWRYEGEELKEKMRQKLDQKESKEIYRRRKQVAERTFADTKEKMGFRDFQLRGLDGVKTEGLWMVISYNISRIYHYLKRCRKTLKEMLGDELNIKGKECEPILTT